MIRWNKKNGLEHDCELLMGQSEKLAQGILEEVEQEYTYAVVGEIARGMNVLVNSLEDYMSEICHVLSHVSTGNLTVKFEESKQYKGDFKMIRNALVKCTTSLQSTFIELQELAGEMGKISLESSHSSEVITKNVKAQKHQIGDLNHSIKTMKQAVETNVSYMSDMTEEVLNIQKRTQEGLNEMKKLLLGMQRVQQASSQIEEVVLLIQGIADQTKLLSLNASIEAARESAKGNGFMVVAEQIGKLAMDTTQAVSKTKELISNSQATIEENGVLVEASSKMFEEMDSSIEMITNTIMKTNEISQLEMERINETATISDQLLASVKEDEAFASNSEKISNDLNAQIETMVTVLNQYEIDGKKKHESGVSGENNRILSLIQNMANQLCNRQTKSEIEETIQRMMEDNHVIECVYVINEAGKQITDTILSKEINILDQKNFSPAKCGDDYSTQIYFRKGMKAKNKTYATYEYISSATGAMCKTYTYCYETQDGHKQLLCIDVKM